MKIFELSWRLHDDGGGIVDVFEDHGSHIDQRRYVFERMTDLPGRVAELISADGRLNGRWTGNRDDSPS